MEQFVESLTPADHKDKFSDFKQFLQQIDKHPNDRYFILKSIIINNLFGVDIMEEAVEICKLRLFLRLVAQVETADEIEPLPDIDFNIRAGNTLVGFATREQVRKSMEGTLGFAEKQVEKINEDALAVECIFKLFREQQTKHGGRVTAKDKQKLRTRLATLDLELDRYLAGEYGVDPKKPEAFEQWRKTHQPFHWFVEFYGIMRDGGFDVIIGNPPWVEYATVKKQYTVKGYETERCGNLHTMCSERSLAVRSNNGSFSFIVQLPLANSSRMDIARALLRRQSNTLHVVPFDDRPGKLFDGLQHCRSVIFLSRGRPANGSALVLSAKYQRWPTQIRSALFQRLSYTALQEPQILTGHFAKMATDAERSAFAKVVRASAKKVDDFLSARPTKHFVFYQEATQYWVKAVVGLPYYAKNGKVGAPAHGRYLYLPDEKHASVLAALMNSSLFYAYFIAYGDCFHLSDTLATSFPVPDRLFSDDRLAELGRKLCQSLREHAERKTINTRDGHKIAYDEFVASESKSLIDQVDTRLGSLYGFDQAELDFVINYDIKFRIGADDAGDDD